MVHRTDIDLTAITAVLLDIEGTTTPIDFVYKTLFPYARERMSSFLAGGIETEDLDLLRAEYATESDRSLPAWSEPPIEYLLWLMVRDRKSRGLKSIQGKIWERGYRDGALRGELFPDVPAALKQWKNAGKRIFIYSSGSVQAQRLIVRYSDHGDLTGLIDGYFDTEIGAKRESASYRAIALRIGLAASKCLFISDITAELDAASAAGFHVLQALRPGNAEQAGSYPGIHSFADLSRPVSEFTGSGPEEAR